MRLIDADTLQEHFEKVKKESESLVDVAQIIGIQAVIDSQPTAYDVDKVVVRLEESKEIYAICGGMLHVYAVRIDKAINAVKGNMAAGHENTE